MTELANHQDIPQIAPAAPIAAAGIFESLPTPVQGAFFDESAFPAGRELLLPIAEQLHRYTGEQVARNQERLAGIIAALGEGLSIRTICKAYRVGQHTVEGIRDRESALVATEKERAGKLLRRVARMALERLEEALENDEITAGQLPVCAGILLDKSMAWDGQATTISVVRHDVTQETVRKLFAGLVRPAIDVEIVSTIGTVDSKASDYESKPLQIEGNDGQCGNSVGQTTTATLPAEGAGGGSALAGAPTGADRLGLGNFAHKKEESWTIPKILTH